MLYFPEIGKKYRCTKESGLNPSGYPTGKVVMLLGFSPCVHQHLHSIDGVKCPGYCTVKVEDKIGEESLCLCTYVTPTRSFDSYGNDISYNSVFWSIEPVEELKVEPRFIQKRMIRL